MRASDPHPTISDRTRSGAAPRHGALAGLAPVHLYYAFVGAVGMIFSQAAECRRLTGLDPTTSRALVYAHADAMVRLFLGPA